MERRNWTEEEDVVLREIIESEPGLKWNAVAEAMEKRYGLVGRSGKQCRQRWHNQLHPRIRTTFWTQEEWQELLHQHNLLGNRWAQISRALPGRTDNCVKNYFYCRLRKAVRRFNGYLRARKIKWAFRDLSDALLSKVVSVAEDKFERKLRVPEQLSEQCCDIKNKLLHFADRQVFEPEDERRAVELGNLLEDFNKSYKKKRGRKKRRDHKQTVASCDSDEEPYQEKDEIWEQSCRIVNPSQRVLRSTAPALAQLPAQQPTSEAKLQQQPVDGGSLTVHDDNQTHPSYRYIDERVQSNDSANLDSIFDVLRRPGEEASSPFEMDE